MGLLKGETIPTSAIGSSSGGFNAVLDRGAAFEGKLTFEGTVRIDGGFKGEIHSDANLVIGESGKVEADITVGSISISGEVKGNITAKGKVEIHAPAVVNGNIHTPSLVIEDGVIFEGSCVMERSKSTSRYHNKPLSEKSTDSQKETKPAKTEVAHP